MTLSPPLNLRQDRYGGTFEKRLMVNDQYDIMKAISLGVTKVKQFIAERENRMKQMIPAGKSFQLRNAHSQGSSRNL